MSKAFLMPENSKFKTVFIPNELLAKIQDGNQNFSINTRSNGSNINLSTVEAQKLQLGQSYASTRQITESCFAIRNTLFNAVTPKPTWYDGLNGKFNDVKDCANDWLNNISVAVTSTIPSSVIDFVPVFTACSNSITAILQRPHEILSESELRTIREILTRMITKVDEISKKVNKYASINDNQVASGKLIDWSKDMSNAGLALKSGKETIQKAATDLSNEIVEYNGKIDSLKNDITYYNKLVAMGAGLVGGGIFVGILGGVLCMAFPVAGGIVMALGIGMVIGGSVAWGVYQDKINKAKKDIADFTTKISERNRTLVALTSLTTSVDLVVSSAESAVSNLTDFASSWTVFGTSLKSTLATLNQGKIDVESDLIELDLNNAIKHWAEVKEYANKLMDTPKEIKVIPADKSA